MRSVLRFETLDSSNAKALALAREGERECAVVCERQTQGRGRQGRHFVSEAGGLYLSVLTSKLLPGDALLALTPAASLAARRAILRTYGLACDVKYPNDLQLCGKKVCGILCESLSFSERFCTVIGVGVNVCTDLSRQPFSAASLADFCEKAQDISSVFALETAMLEEIDELIDRFAAGGDLDEEAYRSVCIDAPAKIISF